MATESTPTFDIPKECIAGVVKNEGPDFYVEVEKVPVPEIGTAPLCCRSSTASPAAIITDTEDRS